MLELHDPQLEALGQDQAAQYARQLIQRLGAQLKFEQAKNQALNFEVARLKQWRFGSSSESLDTKQSELFESGLEAVLIAEAKAEDDGADQARKPASVKRQAKRLALPEGLERIEHHYEIEPAVCPLGHALKRIGQETSEQLDCVPAQFFVHLHIRGKYACVCCQTVLAATMPAQVIDKGIPAAGLLAQVIVAKFDDHLPLFRQEEIYQRSGVFIHRSTMGGWVGQCGERLLPLVQAINWLRVLIDETVRICCRWVARRICACECCLVATRRAQVGGFRHAQTREIPANLARCRLHVDSINTGFSYGRNVAG